MPRSKPALVPLHEVVPGQLADFFALLTERKKNSTRDGKPFYACRFRDTVRMASCMVWSDSLWFKSCDEEWREGRFFKIRGTLGEHGRYGPQIEILNIRETCEADRTDGFNPAEFYIRSRFDVDAMYTDLRGIAETSIADLPLRTLVLTALDRNSPALKRLPATTRHFYPFVGGLLEHTLSVTSACLVLANHYRDRYPTLKPSLNVDVIVAGAILHDIGRVREFTDSFSFERTVPGRLVGPLFLGRDLVREIAAELGNVDPSILELLEHMLVAHLNLLEKDSPRLPLIPESLILHHADALDGYLEMFTRCLQEDGADGKFTENQPVLGRRLFKGRSI